MPFREKILILVSILIIAIFALIILVIFPLISQVTEVKNQIEEQRISLEIIKGKSENITEIQKDYELIIEKKEKIDKLILTADNQLDLFKDIEDLAQQNNLIQNYTLESPNSNAKEIKIDIRLSGDYLKILAYLRGLESLDYYIKLISVSFDVLTSGTVVNSTLQAKTYWQ